jgi:hypothetical protein
VSAVMYAPHQLLCKASIVCPLTGQQGFQRNLDSYCRVVSTELATRHSITSSAAACRTSGIAVPSNEY